MDAPDVIAFVGIILIAVLMLGFHLVSIARDSDWWVIARGVASGKRARAERFMRGVLRG